MSSGDPNAEKNAVDDASALTTTLKKRVKAAFDLFDRDGKGIVVKEEIGTIMRYLGSYPTEEELQTQIIPRIREDEDSHFIRYDRFEPVMVSILSQGDYEPDLDDVVLQAFKMIDHERKGYISDYRMIQLLTSNEYKFRQKELEQFLKISKDDTSDKIFYEDYVKILAKDLEELRARKKEIL